MERRVHIHALSDSGVDVYFACYLGVPLELAQMMYTAPESGVRGAFDDAGIGVRWSPRARLPLGKGWYQDADPAALFGSLRNTD